MNDYNLKSRLCCFILGISKWKWNFWLFNFGLVTWKLKNKSFFIDWVTQVKVFLFQLRVSNLNWNFLFFNFKLVTWNETFYFQLWICNLKWHFLLFFLKKENFNLPVSHLKWNLIYFDVDLITQKKNFCKTLVTGSEMSFCINWFLNLVLQF